MYSEGELSAFNVFTLLNGTNVPMLNTIFNPPYVSTHFYLYGDGIIRIEQ